MGTDEIQGLGALIDAADDWKDVLSLANRLHLIAIYAELRAKAGEHRLAGRVEWACRCEAHADKVYKRLPEDCKW